MAAKGKELGKVEAARGPVEEQTVVVGWVPPEAAEGAGGTDLLGWE